MMTMTKVMVALINEKKYNLDINSLISPKNVHDQNEIDVEVVNDMQMLDPSKMGMQMKVNMLTTMSIVMIEKMENLMMKSIMMSITTISRTMGMKEVRRCLEQS